MRTLKTFVNILDTANNMLIRIIEYVLAVILSIQIILIFVTAIMRYLFNHAIPWTDELTTYLLVAITFLGGYVASNKGALAKVELISSLFKGITGKVIQVLSRLISGGLVGWIAIYGTQLFFSPIVQNQTSSAMRMPVKFIWWTLPASMWLLLFTEVLGIIHIFVPKQEETSEVLGSEAEEGNI